MNASFLELIVVPSCRAAVLIPGLFALRYLLGKRLSPKWRHALWSVPLLALLPLPTIPSPVSMYDLLPAIETQKEPGVERSATHGLTQLASQPGDCVEYHYVPGSLDVDTVIAESLVASPGDYVEYHYVPGSFGLIIFWLTGSLVMLSIFVRQTLRCRRWIAKAMPVTNECVLTIFESCRLQMKIKTWLVIAESPLVSGPFLVGTIRPTLLLPQGMIESATEKQLRTVFLHELAHLKRWDVWTGYLTTLLLIVHWFNPLLWPAIRRMNADREEACDAAAMELLNQNDRWDYAYSLIDITKQFCTTKGAGDGAVLRAVPGLVGIFETKTFLTGRLDMIQQIGTWKLRWKILALTAMLLIGTVTLTDAQEKRTKNTKKTAAEIQQKIDKLQARLQEMKEEESDIAKEERPLWVSYKPSMDVNTALSLAQALLPNVRMVVDSEHLFVLGRESEHDTIWKLLDDLEKKEKEPEKEDGTSEETRVLKIYRLPDHRVDTVFFYIKAIVAAGVLEARLIRDDATNSIIIQGSPAEHEKIYKMLKVWEQKEEGVDVRGDTKEDEQILKNLHLASSVDKVFPLAQALLADSPDTRLEKDKHANSIIFWGSESDYNKLLKMAHELAEEECKTLNDQISKITKDVHSQSAWNYLGIRFSAIGKGVYAQEFSKYLADYPDGAIRVEEVRPNSPMSRCGVEKGDVIFGINNLVTATEDDVRLVIDKLQINRSGVKSVDVRLNRPRPHEKEPANGHFTTTMTLP